MTNTLYIAPRSPRLDLPTVLWRIAVPFAIFSAVLAILLAFSRTALLPRYTRIDVGGTLRNATQIRQYRETLTAQIATKEEARRQSVLAVHDPQYDMLKDERRTRTSLDDLRAQLTDHAKAITGEDDVVEFHSFDYDPAGKKLKMTGDVRAGTRSMTVLADFAQTLKTLPFVAVATMPTFTREDDPKTGFRSPFNITLTLK